MNLWLLGDNHQGPTGNSAQSYVAAWMGGEFAEEWILVNVQLSLSADYLKLL